MRRLKEWKKLNVDFERETWVLDSELLMIIQRSFFSFQGMEMFIHYLKVARCSAWCLQFLVFP